MPIKDAFSYRLTAANTDKKAPLADTTTVPITPTVLTCDRDEVTPGEQVVVQGKQLHEVMIPADARPGQRLWLQFESALISPSPR